MPHQQVVLLFVKAPVKGQVKSRLAADVGEEAALDLYKNFTLDMVRAVEKSCSPLRICFYPPEKESAVSAWLGPHYLYMPQRGSDLGMKMEDAFERIFSEGYTRCILIGSDIPDLPPSILTEAFESLKNSDVVIGPAADGGYYLIGFNKRSFLSRIFQGVPWSTNIVFEETMSILKSAALRVHQLPPWHDVDTLGDLQSLFDRNTSTAFAQSRTMTYLLKLQLLENVKKKRHV